jgi:addiction module HigA family antidote
MRYVWTDAGFENVIVEDYHPRCPMTDRLYPPIHPGEILQEDFLDGFGITQHKLAASIGVPPRRINEIVHGKRRISADTALRLGRYFATDPQFWINLQARYDLEVEKDALGDSLDSIQPLRTA